MMKILVTGGAGFIGSHLVDSLSLDNEVVVLDNLIRGSKLTNKKKVKFIKKNIKNYCDVNECIKDCEIVYHLAAFLGVDEVAKNPIKTMETESIGTYNVMNAALKNNVKKIIYASTSEVYGKVDKVEAVNEDFKVSPISSYAIAKRYNEIYLKSIYLEHKIDSFSLRYFNIYGPRQDTRMVIPRFFQQAMNGDDLIVYGDGKQTRDFTFIDDTIEATIQIAKKCSGSEIINITKGEDITIYELAEKILKIVNSRSKIKLIENPLFRKDFEVERRFGSNQKLQSLIGSKPQTTLDEGLEKTYKYILENK
ncbi:MAG: nucleoside-diphosphate sugar epimerase [Parcubacteria group bacterium]|nr:nucleoside-diphosphate sugar epimerase [Parcubacteria group bacterium]